MIAQLVHKKYRKCWTILFFTLAIVMMAILPSHDVKAASDKTKPTLKVSVNTTDYAKSVLITITATDKSGIKSLKYSDSYEKTSFFKTKGIKLTQKNKKASVRVTKNGTYTFYALDKAGNTQIKRIEINQIDTTEPKVELSDSVANQVATISVKATDLESGIQKIQYLEGSFAKDSKEWENSTDITETSNFQVTKSGYYTVKATDGVRNEAVSEIYVTMELRAMWISYLEFSSKGYTKESFTEHIETMFDRVVELNMNAVIVQVRSFGDAMYDSDYFPWSKYSSGIQGVDPGFDPMEIMIEAAHIRDLEFHAWLNPYRITTGSADLDLLSDDNQAKKWLTDNETSNDRNVLTYKVNNVDSLFYNPASSEVRKLIVNGIKEIVKNYDVDGIHFDDYFYPALGSKYETVFDYLEYEDYVETRTTAGKTVKTIADWRRGNVNTLVKSVYSAIKEIDSSVSFGISPHGNIDNLESDQKYYVDVKTWLSNEGYVDYICPQVYWSFEYEICPFDEVLDRWIALRTNEKIKIYAGIATYKADYNATDDWSDEYILSDMVQYSRDTGVVDGFMFFRYAFFNHKASLPAVEQLIPMLLER